jgi:iron-sulfur cluster repair protein YtfE (RIC family)
MNKLLTNYFSAIDDLVNLYVNQIRMQLDIKTAHAREYYQLVNRILSSQIEWEQEIVFPLFEEKHHLLFKIGPTAAMQLEHQHIKMLLNQIDANFEVFLSRKAMSENLFSSKKELNIVIEELEKTLIQHNIKRANIFYPAIDESLSADEIAQLLVMIKQPLAHI